MAGLSRWPVFRALVSGPSMSPTLQHGDGLLVRRSARSARPGSVVLARFRSMPDRVVVKRVIRADGDGWWLEGDNEFGSDGSQKHGVADLEGVVMARYWPSPRRLMTPTERT